MGVEDTHDGETLLLRKIVENGRFLGRKPKRRTVREYSRREALGIFSLVTVGSIFWALKTQRKPSSKEVHLISEIGPQPPTQEEIYEANWSIFPSTITYWRDDIQRWAEMSNIDEFAIATLILIESAGHPALVSEAGAIGLGQVMPFHLEPQENPDVLLIPEVNMQRGLNYFNECLNTHAGGDLRLAFACYNGGPGSLNQGFSPETVRAVEFSILADTNVDIEIRKQKLAQWVRKWGMFIPAAQEWQLRNPRESLDINSPVAL